MRGDSSSRSKKPGPRPTACMWCGSTECTHCRCSGQTGCNHKKGEMCPNPRYKRRLVCNSCEKNKLREKQQCNISSSRRKKAKNNARVSKKRENTKSVVSVRQPHVNTVPEKKEIPQTPTCKGIYVSKPIVAPPHYAINIVLNNTGDAIGVLTIQKLDVPLSLIRPIVYRYLTSYLPESSFCFMKDSSLVSLEDESMLSVAQICITQGGVSSLFIHRVETQVYPSVSSLHYQPSYPSIPVVAGTHPSSSYVPNQPSVVPNEVLSYANELPNPNETAMQRFLREAKASGKIDEMLNQPIPPAAELGLDDTPRELVPRNSSFFPYNSMENLYSGNGSMLFASSRHGSILFNPVGSNLSLDLKDSNFVMFEDIINRLHDGEYDDTDKGAPTL